MMLFKVQILGVSSPLFSIFLFGLRIAGSHIIVGQATPLYGARLTGGYARLRLVPQQMVQEPHTLAHPAFLNHRRYNLLTALLIPRRIKNAVLSPKTGLGYAKSTYQSLRAARKIALLSLLSINFTLHRAENLKRFEGLNIML
jgi:hypothetical protein